MILADAHTHSLFSHDGKASREEMARSARAKGLSVQKRVRYFEDAIFSARPDSDPPVSLPLAIEVGEMGEAFSEAKELLARRPYEFVLGALHHLKGEKGFLSREYASDGECRILFARYLEELLAAAEETDYDSLAHMDYPLSPHKRAGRVPGRRDPARRDPPRESPGIEYRNSAERVSVSDDGYAPPFQRNGRRIRNCGI